MRHDMSHSKIKTGDHVKFLTMPLGIETLTEESLHVFRFCLDRVYRVAEIDSGGLLVLNVSADIDHRFGGFVNDILVEPECVTKVEPPADAE